MHFSEAEIYKFQAAINDWEDRNCPAWWPSWEWSPAHRPRTTSLGNVYQSHSKMAEGGPHIFSFFFLTLIYDGKFVWKIRLFVALWILIRHIANSVTKWFIWPWLYLGWGQDGTLSVGGDSLWDVSLRRIIPQTFQSPNRGLACYTPPWSHFSSWSASSPLAPKSNPPVQPCIQMEERLCGAHSKEKENW